MFSKKCSLNASFILMSLLTLMLCIGNVAQAQESEQWNYTIAMYAWLPGIEGTVGALGRSVEVDASIGDLLSNTKFGVMSGFRAEKDRIAITADFIYARLGAENDFPPVEVNINPLLVEGDFGYEVAKDFEIYGGARILSVENKIELKAPIQIEAKATKTWVDPVVGIRFMPRLSDRWSLLTKADIGGFGAGSDFTYQLQGYALLNLTEKASLAFGYRYLDIDYQEESGSQFRLDMKIDGPAIGFIYKF